MEKDQRRDRVALAAAQVTVSEIKVSIPDVTSYGKFRIMTHQY